LTDKIKALQSFGFDEFCDASGIISAMIDELPAYIAMVNTTTNSFWNNVEGAKEYDEDLVKKSTDDPAQYGDKA
jgi:hypothetical protein